MDSVGRCTGHCCEDFTLPISPMQFSWWAKLLKLGKKPFYWRMYGRRYWPGEVSMNAGSLANYQPEEIAKVSDMVIFKYASKTCKGNPNRKIDHILYHYTCKHFDKKSGNCLNYEDRPDMCRMYPNAGTCKYKGCTSPCAKPCTAIESNPQEKAHEDLSCDKQV